MPFGKSVSEWKSKFEALTNEAKAAIGQPQPHAQQQQQYPPPHGQPGFMAQQAPPQQPVPSYPNIYWQPRFDPSIPISQDWEHKTGNNNGWGNNEMQNYTNESQNSFCPGNNVLVLRASAQSGHPDPARKYTSARLVSRQRLARPRGSLVASLSLPCAPGIWPAFWLLPFEPFQWPTDGEVDIAETWNGDQVNHTCLHWGFYTPEDNWKHRVVGTPIQGMSTGRPVRYEFAWDQDPNSKNGRLIWWIDGRPIMRAPIPQGLRPLQDYVVLLNIAMGGNVTQGRTPGDGNYDFVVHDMRMIDEPENGGWNRFNNDWNQTPEGQTL